MKRRNIIILVIVLVLALVGTYFYLSGKKRVLAKVSTVLPEKGDIFEIVSSTGTIQPVDTVAVGTQVSGIISKIYTDYNSHVTEGQLLAELDPTLMQANVDQIKANLQQSLSNQNYQSINYERQKKLYDVGAISKAEYDVAFNTYEQAKASVASIRAQLTSAQQNLSFTKIYSPMSGVVLNRNVSVGQTVAASFNTPTLFSLAKDITKMQVQAKVDEADIGGIKAGQRVTFTVDAYIDKVFNGTVQEVRLQPSTSSNVVTYTTIINASNDNMELKPGMTATTTIYTKEATGVQLLPINALKFSPESSSLPAPYRLEMGKDTHTAVKDTASSDSVAYIWVKNGYILSKKQITTGINDNTKVEVTSGLSLTDTVATGVEEVSAAEAAGEGGSPFLPKFPKRRR